MRILKARQTPAYNEGDPPTVYVEIEIEGLTTFDAGIPADWGKAKVSEHLARNRDKLLRRAIANSNDANIPKDRPDLLGEIDPGIFTRMVNRILRK